jgi:(p)ppGpp synthase/HD superfamily hydrolase
MWAACRLAESSPVKDQERASLESLVLAAYIQKATALIGRRRRVGGNQFRHAMATFAILVDYHYTDAVLLKASVIHDLFEDIPSTDRDSIREIDADGPAVVDLVLEVTRHQDTPKPEYLARLRDHGSESARSLKVADRISNLTDLHQSVFTRAFVARYLEETQTYVFPMAKAVNSHMAREIADLLQRRSDELLSEPGEA